MKKVITIVLLFSFIAATINLHVAAHYCGGKIAEIKILYGTGKASCGMEDETMPCNNLMAGINKKNCCEDELSLISIKDNYTPTSPKVDLTKAQAVFITVLSTIIKINDNGYDIIRSQYHPPPDNHSSVYLPFIQVFLV